MKTKLILIACLFVYTLSFAAKKLEVMTPLTIGAAKTGTALMINI